MAKKRNTFGSVYQRGDGWYIRVRQKGEPDWRKRVCAVACTRPEGGGPYLCTPDKCRCGKGKKLAEGKLAEMRAKLEREEALGVKEVGRITMADFWTTLRPILASRLTEQGAKINAGMFTIAADYFGKKALADLGAADVDAFFAFLKDKVKGRGCSGATCNRYGSLLSIVFKTAKDRGFARENPVADVKRSREDVRSVPFLTAENILRVVACTPAPFREVVILAFETGCRRGELLALAVQDVDLERGVLIVRRSKTGKPREVPLSPRARALVESVLAAPRAVPLRGPELLLPDADGDVLSRKFPAWVEAAGLPRMTFHGCRHVFASSLVRAGVPIPTVSALLGHSSPAMVLSRYGSHAPADARQQAMAALAVLWGQTPAASAPPRAPEGAQVPTAKAV